MLVSHMVKSLKTTVSNHSGQGLSVILGACRRVNEACCTVMIGSQLLTVWDSLSVPSSGVKQ